jgi:hypothetical protein
MRFRGALMIAVVLCASAGCSKDDPPAPVEADEVEGALEDSLEYTEKQMAADDPRTRFLEKIGQGDEVPEDASLEELQALLDEKVEKGIIPEEHAKKLLKVLESADEHNKRLERLDEELFGENVYGLENRSH